MGRGIHGQYLYLNPEYNNYDIACMFASVPRRSLVLMEDFDNYFDKRTCLMKNDQVKFTFDAVDNLSKSAWERISAAVLAHIETGEQGLGKPGGSMSSTDSPSAE